MDLFSMPTFNGKYVRPNTAKPIAGWVATNSYKRALVECKISSDYVLPGYPVYVTTSDGSNTNAGQGLNPNVLNASTPASTSTAISGFLVVSPTDVQPEGEEAAYAIQNQISQVALLHSGAELYLPVNATALASKDVVNTTLYWNTTSGQLDSTGVELEGLVVMGEVVDGIKISKASSSTAAAYVDCSVVKVKLA